MDTWSPLFANIIFSSVWRLPVHVRLVWFFLIAVKDRNGFVSGSVPGLAHAARVSDEEFREAMATFEAPDPDSGCPDDEGRRIRKVEGGWLILGHQRFQKKMQEVSARIGSAKRQKDFREREKAKAMDGHTSKAAQKRDAERRATPADKAAKAAYVRSAAK